jgi:hypothetical protein
MIVERALSVSLSPSRWFTVRIALLEWAMWHACRVVAVNGDAYQRMASRVIGQVSMSAVGRELDGVAVAAVFHYGAVDIDPPASCRVGASVG